jgi:hypothetical protein
MSICGCRDQGYLASQSVGDLSYAPAPRAPFDQALRADCGPGMDGDALDRKPYLQRVTTSGAMVLWTSDAHSSFAVRLLSADGDEVSRTPAIVDDSAPLPSGAQYVASLTDLEPGRLYCYEILDAEQVVSGPWGFRTAPDPSLDAPVAFAVMGDVGIRQPDQFFVRDQLYTVESQFSLISGDVAYSSGTLEEFEDNFFAMYATWLRHVPVFPASGNHDYRTRSAAPFREVFALPENGGPDGIERWYSFDWGPIHIAVLDTERVNSEQAAWLEADLAATDLPWRLAVLHRPPYSSGQHGSDKTVRRKFSPIFERYAVQVVFAGHDHDYERTAPQNGVTYLVTGGGGRGTRAVGRSSFTEFSERVAHFTYVVVDGDELTLYAVDALGDVFDTARISATQP